LKYEVQVDKNTSIKTFINFRCFFSFAISKAFGGFVREINSLRFASLFNTGSQSVRFDEVQQIHNVLPNTATILHLFCD
jgi:hypothetical protein